MNKWAMGSNEIRENCSTMNSNDTTLFSSCLLHYMSLNTRETFFSPEYGSKCKWEYLRLLILVFEPLVIKHVEIKHRGFTLVVILTSRWSDSRVMDNRDCRALFWCQGSLDQRYGFTFHKGYSSEELYKKWERERERFRQFCRERELPRFVCSIVNRSCIMK